MYIVYLLYIDTICDPYASSLLQITGIIFLFKM